MGIFKIIGKGIKVIGKAANSSIGKKVIKAGAAIGAGLATAGAGLAIGANSKNKKAQDIKNNAILIHDKNLKETEKVLEELAYEEAKCTDNFERMIYLMKRINRCPSIGEIQSSIDLPRISMKELKQISEGFELAMAGIAGAGVSAAAGAAFCGLTISTLGIAAFGGGVFICAKGAKLHQQAVKNLDEALTIQKDVEKIVAYYVRLQEASNILKNAIIKVKDIYIRKLNKLDLLLEGKNDYVFFSNSEKKLVKNCIKLTMMLVKMCRVKLAKKVSDVEVVNTEEIHCVIEDSDIIIEETKDSIFDKAYTW